MQSDGSARGSPRITLAARGLTILERNWRSQGGELDIVAREGSTLVFVEVKTRSSLAFGSPAEAVGRQKISRIRRLALRWIDEHRVGNPWWKRGALRCCLGGAPRP